MQIHLADTIDAVYVKFRKFMKFKKLRRWLRFKTLSIQEQGPPVYFDSPIVVEGENKNIVTVAIRVTGGLGDFIVAARFIRDLCRYVGNLRIDVYCPSEGVAAWAFNAVPDVAAIYNESFFHHVFVKYDIAMVVNQMAYYHGEQCNYAKINNIAPRLLTVLAALNKSRPQWDLFIQQHPFMDGAMAHNAVALGHNRNTLLYAMSGLQPGPHDLPIVLDDSVTQVLRGKFSNWITVNNGFDANFAIGSRAATKCYPLKHWNDVVAALKKARPDVAIVQIGSRTSEAITGIDLNLISQTSLPQAASLIGQSLLHIDSEGGLVHVAAAVGRSSAVLFGPTSLHYFAYPQNLNLSSDFCGNCWWTKKSWMEKCPREYEAPLCMEYLAPAKVAAAVLGFLREQPALQLDDLDAPVAAFASAL